LSPLELKTAIGLEKHAPNTYMNANFFNFEEIYEPFFSCSFNSMSKGDEFEIFRAIDPKKNKSFEVVYQNASNSYDARCHIKCLKPNRFFVSISYG